MIVNDTQGFEIGFFRRKNGVTEEEMLQANRVMEEHFLLKEEKIIKHMTIKMGENLYADIAIAQTKLDTQEICSKWTDNRYSLSFLNLIEVVQFEGLEMLTFADIINGPISKVLDSKPAHEIVSFRFKDDISLEDQKLLMCVLNEKLVSYDGFNSRDYYYSVENGRWIDFVVWSDVNLAKRASESILNDPQAGSVFSKIDEKTIIFSHYERVGGVKKD